MKTCCVCIDEDVLCVDEDVLGVDEDVLCVDEDVLCVCPLIVWFLPYDSSCPRLNTKVNNRVCKKCGIYYHSISAMKRSCASQR